MTDYFDWRSKKEGAGTPHRRRRTDPKPADTESGAAPSEPIQVVEFDGASSTIIRRIRRFWTDKRS